MSQPESDEIAAAAELLRRGEVVGFPTETVYGLGANAWDEQAVAKIYAAKGRPTENPLIVHILDASCLGQCVAMPLRPDLQAQVDAVLDFWPGPLTLILPRAERVPLQVTAGRDTVAVRVPAAPRRPATVGGL